MTKELLALWLLLAVLVMGDLDNLSVVHLQYANIMCVFTFSLLFLAFLHSPMMRLRVLASIAAVLRGCHVTSLKEGELEAFRQALVRHVYVLP